MTIARCLETVRRPAALLVAAALLFGMAAASSGQGPGADGPEADRSRSGTDGSAGAGEGQELQAGDGGMTPGTEVQETARWIVTVSLVPRGSGTLSQSQVTVTAGSEEEARRKAVEETRDRKPGNKVSAVSARKIRG
ncbi:MAG: hypothetical protein LBR80_06710 [Deltaproteobacteria bacterium]|nr:hypothetical protein [Deltaproteobacteria bacterium]